MIRTAGILPALSGTSRGRYSRQDASATGLRGDYGQMLINASYWLLATPASWLVLATARSAARGAPPRDANTPPEDPNINAAIGNITHDCPYLVRPYLALDGGDRARHRER